MTMADRTPMFTLLKVIRGLLLGCLLGFTACSPAAHPESAEIETFLNRYFSTWSAKDMQGYSACFDSSARITFVSKSGPPSSQGLTDFIHGQKLGHERAAEPMVEVPTSMKISGDSRVALAEVRWKLTKGREIVTGTDFFTLMRTADGWRIAALVFYND